MVNFQMKHNGFVTEENFKKIFEITLFNDKPDKNGSNIIHGLRILFCASGELQHFGDDLFHKILNILIELLHSGQEPILTHAIKCLQLFIFNGKRIEKSHPQLQQLIPVVIKNLTKYINFESDDSLISAQCSNDQETSYVDDFNKSLIREYERGEADINIPRSNISDLIYKGIISKASQQKFHYLALINYLINIINLEELINNQELYAVLYRCLNVSRVRSDACIALSLQIIYKLMDNSSIYSKLLTDDILYRVLAVPCYFNSSYYVVKILLKIWKKYLDDDDLVHQIIKCDQNIIKFITDYIFQSRTNCVDYDGLNAVPTLARYLTLIELNEINALTLIIKEFHQLEFYKAAKSDINNDIDNFKKLFDEYQLQIQTFCDFVQIYFVKYVIHQKPILTPNTEKEIIEIFRNIFEILHIFLRRIYQENLKPETIRLYKSVSQILNFCILIQDVRNLFYENLECFPKYPPNITNIISVLLLILDNYFMDPGWRHFLPYQIINYLLMRCCTSFESYKACVNGTNPKPSASNEICVILKYDATKIIDELMAGSFLLYAHNSFGKIVNPHLKIRNGIYLIRCLLVMSENDRVLELISGNHYLFIKIYKSYLKNPKISSSPKPLRNKFIKYSKILKNKVKHVCPGSIEISQEHPSDSFKINYGCTQETLSSVEKTNIHFQQCTSHASNQFQEIINKSSHSKLPNDNNRIPCGCVESEHFKISGADVQEKIKFQPKTFERVKEFYSEGRFCTDHSIKILKDDNILIPDCGLIHLFHNNQFFPKFYCDFMTINHLVDNFNGDFVLGCGETPSYFMKCLMWKYDGLHDDNPRVYPCQKFDNISHAQFSSGDKTLIGLNPNFDIQIYDIETGQKYSELRNPERRCIFTSDCLQSNSYTNLIFSNGELYCVKTGKLIHVFDRFQYIQSGIFTVSENEIIYGRELLDLRSFKIIKQIPNLLKCHLKRTHNDNIYLGYKYQFVKLDPEEGYTSSDFIRNNSYLDSLLFIDPTTFEILSKRPIDELMVERSDVVELADISRDGSWIASRKHDRGPGSFHLFTVFEEGQNEKIRIDIP
ncbi:Protein VPRBP [Thelohanellus kitauei]|uniref:Protein VPRBP n=1 Tax=Thelohanellus kitauei TaxID=669202 RepID=A0A0C2MHT7_THEKT|nr:Protein VPRBP [Thelohanellus kitauei]